MLNRRDLLKQAGAGAALFGMGAAARAEPNLKAGSAVPSKWDETYDVVVVGSGGAGMAAAVKAADQGAKVVVLERLGFPGGNTQLAQGQINAADPVRQPKQGIKDSPELHAKQTLEAGDYRGDPERVRVLCENAYGAITWLESLGMEFQDTVFQMFGGLYPRAHSPKMVKGQGYIKVLLKALDERKVPILKNVRVTDIIRDTPESGDVRGVRVETKEGIRYIRARQGVVLAAGGFSANQYLRELHDPRVAGLGTDNLPNKTAGDVMMAAVRVGGYLVGMDFIQSTPGAPAGKKMKIILNTRVAESIYVDKRGNRIVDEGTRRDVIRDAVLGTPERYAYTVVDNDTYQKYNAAVHKSVEEGIKINEAWTAPTLKELAVKMGVDPEGLEKGVARYNSFVEKGKDEDFGKAPRNLAKKIEHGPFWACYTGMTVHHTMGGLSCNTKAQVLDWQGNVVPRLYAAGEITGGIHGTNRVGGNALLDCFVYGQIAGTNAGQEKRA